MSSRRGIIALVGAVALVGGLPRLWQALAPQPQATPIAGLPGFRRTAGGPVTGLSDPFVGLPGAAEPGKIAAQPVPPNEVCAALFPAPPRPGLVPVAFFTDVNCPYCRIMADWLTEADGDTIDLTWKNLPLLGPGSIAAARATIAAEAQGAGDAMRRRLHRTRFQAEEGYLTALAAGLGLDPARLLADMDAPRTEARIARSLGLAAAFGIPGTPAIVAGRTLAIGNLTREAFDRLIAQEAGAKADWPCQG